MIIFISGMREKEKIREVNEKLIEGLTGPTICIWFGNLQ
jgi:hypothetical protein